VKGPGAGSGSGAEASAAPRPVESAPTVSPSVLLRLEGVSLYYWVRRGLLRNEPVKALEQVDLTLHRGESVAVVGESGSGKTTLGRAALRLGVPTRGRVTFDGRDITAASERALRDFRRRAQAVFQDPYASLSPYMRVYDLVEEPLVVHRVQPARARREAVLAALEQVKLRPASDFVELYPHTLSGGQRQRVNIARAMVLEPEFLVADEPVSMIDASSRAEILYLLRELQEGRDLTLLTITHDLASARHFADRIAVMYLGRVVEMGPSRRVIEAPKHPYTRGLLAAVPEPDPANRHRLRPVIEGEPPSALDVPSGCPFHPRCPEAMPGVCDVSFPAVTRHGEGHEVACHLYPPGEDVGADVSRDGP
jgi:oligopeptide/dipeptide ABC transporter ATP-binding protein